MLGVLCSCSTNDSWGEDILPEEVAYAMEDGSTRSTGNTAFAAAAAGCCGYPCWQAWMDLADLREQIHDGCSVAVQVERRVRGQRDPVLTVRRITINANKVTPDEGIYQVDFFTDTKKLEKEKKLQQAMLGIKNKYGKNAVLKASSYEEGATMRQRNAQIGGHSAGGSDGKLQK